MFSYQHDKEEELKLSFDVFALLGGDASSFTKSKGGSSKFQYEDHVVGLWLCDNEKSHCATITCNQTSKFPFRITLLNL